ncbi:UvrD-helicase domain-containing protein [Candidatus Omnitrophota bacterium]
MDEKGIDDNTLRLCLDAQGKLISKAAEHVVLFIAFAQHIAEFIGIHVTQRSLPFKKRMLELVDRFGKTYNDIKVENKGLDFDDLLFKVAQLLSANTMIAHAVKNRLKRQFMYILVDEYQDTNTIQARIIESLANDDTFFCVGDIRQSIYGFRGADVTVMQSTEKAFNEEEKKNVVPLDHTYRATQKVVKFINEMFLWLNKYTNTINFREMKSSVKQHEDDTPIEVLVTPFDKDADENIDTGRYKEARCIAQRIKELVSSGTSVRNHDGTRRKMRYFDCALLLRVMTNVEIFEKCLREERIPYYIIKGGEFYSSEEIQDIISMFTLLERPYEDIPCATVLRSPLCGLSNDGLYWIGQYGADDETMLFYKKVRNVKSIKEISKNDTNKIQRFLEVYDTIRSQKDHRTIETILTLLLDMTQYEYKTLLMREGERKYANIEKLKEVVKNFDRHEEGTLQTFLTYIDSMTRLEIQEQEASLESESEDTVKILTVHKAKGLEFPVVFVGDMGGTRNQKTEGAFTFSVEHGLGMSLYIPTLDGCIEDAISMRNKEAKKQAEDNEDIRVMYVAFTRARDRLILSGSMKVTKKDLRKNTLPLQWMGRVLAYCECTLKNIQTEGEILLEDKCVRLVLNQIGIPKEAQEDEAIIVQKFVDLHKNVTTLNDHDQKQYDQILSNIRKLNTSPIRDNNYTVTELVTYHTCPKLFQITYETAIPSLLLPPKTRTNQGGQERKSHTERGSQLVGIIFHEIAQHANLLALNEKELLTKLDKYGKVVSSEQYAQLKTCISSLCSKEFKKELCLDAVRSFYAEVPIIGRVEKYAINGQIDVITEYDDHVVLLDYKTSLNRDISDIDDPYTMQLRLYALLYSKIIPNVNIQNIVFFPQTNHYVKHSISQSELDAFESKLTAMLDTIASHEFAQHRSSHCNVCKYLQFCLK